MLTAINVEISSASSGVLPYGNSLYIHGLFFSLINEFDPMLSESIHNIIGFKPYTLSALKGGRKVGWEIEVKENSKYRFRATFLKDELFAAFYDILFLYFKSNKIFRIGKNNFIVSKIDLERNESFEDLAKGNISYDNKFNLTFTSPTSFRVQSKNYIFPDSKYVFRSYFDRWNAFCPENLVIDYSNMEDIVKSCIPVKHCINTELFDMGNYKVVGFKGNCQFEILNELDKDVLVRLNWLLKFSRYSGTGYKTTMGMGQTQINK